MISKRHVCHVSTAHFWSDSRIFERMCAPLAAAGYRVTLVAPIDAPRTERGVEVVPTGLSGKAERFFGVPGLLRRLAALDADIYHFHDPELLPWMALFRALRRGRRVVYDVHEYYADSVIDSNYFGWRPISRLAGAVFDVVEPALGRRLDGVVGVTPPITARFSGGPAHTVTARNVISLAALPAQLEPVELPSAQTIVLGGIMDGNRLMPELVDALALLAPRWPGLSLLGVGDPHAETYGADMLARARRCGIEGRLEYRPRLPWRLLQAHLARSVVGLVLYNDCANNRVALPNRLFDFMAHGVPVIATDFPLVRDVVAQADCGLLLADGRPESIADAIESLLADPARAAALGENGRRAVRTRHNWDIDFALIRDLYARF
jgi:glycosyltransferase involved in cell wall biosynthesis